MDVAATVIVLDAIDSTNDEAVRRLNAGDRPPFWIRARSQTAGRGRRGRSWTGLDGNVFLTGALEMTAPPAASAQLSYAAALALGEAIDRALPAELVRFKWPNDVLVAGRKAAGILLETAAGPAGTALLVGVGVNVAAAPPGAAHLAAHARAGTTLDAEAVAGDFIAAFTTWRARWVAEGFEPVRAGWLARAHGLGGRAQAGAREGVFEDIDAEGALVLRTASGATMIRAGEVFFPADEKE